MRNLSLFIIVALGTLASPAAAAEPAASPPLRALLITGGCCHDYTTQKQLLSEGISARAKVVCTVVQQGGTTTNTKIPAYVDPNWAKGFDVVIHDECLADVADPAWTERILKPHREGLPAVLLHCAMHSYRDKTDEWFKFCGVTSHRHGAHYPYTVDNIAKDHPIMARFGSRWQTPKGELYQVVKVWPDTVPLAQAQSRETKKDELVIWTNTYGKGRVFGTTIGHHNETVASPEYLDVVTRGLLWAAGKLDDEHLQPLVAAVAPGETDAAPGGDGWKSISNGKDFEGWKWNENPESWKIEEGAFVAHGKPSHLYYVGEKEPFKNFEFQCEVKTLPGSNGGICFHTGWLDKGWPTLRQGLESQVANTHKDPQRTGGLYNIVKINPSPAQDNQWWKHYIKVDGKHVIVKIDDKVVVDYTEPADAKGTATLGEGMFCLQAHDPNSTVYYRKVKVKRLP